MNNDFKAPLIILGGCLFSIVILVAISSWSTTRNLEIMLELAKLEAEYNLEMVRIKGDCDEFKTE